MHDVGRQRDLRRRQRLATALFQVIGTVGMKSVCTPGGICLDSTVGTDLSPNACGMAVTIDATVGDQLNFCYTVTNNTGVELDYHSLANNVDGDLLDFTLRRSRRCVFQSIISNRREHADIQLDMDSV